MFTRPTTDQVLEGVLRELQDTVLPHVADEPARVAPRKGMLLAWDNMNPDGSPNTATLHEGMAVLEGTKYIITKWFREEPWGRRPRA